MVSDTMQPWVYLSITECRFPVKELSICFKGMQLICGQAVDLDLLKLVQTDLSELYNSVQEWQEENQDAQVL